MAGEKTPGTLAPSLKPSSRDSDRGSTMSSNGLNDKKHLLSPSTKKQRHCASETNRRNNLHSAFIGLSNLIPHMKGREKSDVPMLEATLEALDKMEKQKEELRREANSRGISDAEFERFYAPGSGAQQR